MRFKLFIISLIAILYLPAQFSKAHEINGLSPMMLEDKNYTEYWEQFFYLDDGSLVTSQYLVANFAWPVGKDHGIMLGTLVTPEGKQYVIKNGRKPGKWGYKEGMLDMFIHTHRLSSSADKLTVHLENTMGIVDLNLTSTQAPIDHKSFSSEDGFIETSFYAPSLTGYGNWQLGPEAGFKPSGPVHNAELAQGFGVHVIMNDKVDALIKNWTRVIGISAEGPKPFMSAITRPDDSREIILKLFEQNDVLDTFSNIEIKYHNMTEEKDASYPKSIEVSATGEHGTLKGTITFTKKLSYFNLTEHLNFFERTFAKSNPAMVNFRYLADYNLIYKTDEGEKEIIGKGLSEYIDILASKKPPRKRRRNRR